jgi:hypothetical protein
MFTIFSVQKRALIALTMLALLVFLLAGCGQAGTGGSSTAGSGSAATSTPTVAPTPVKGYGSANGCPSDMVVGVAPPQANVTVLASDVNKTIIANNGDVIEIRLPFGRQWSGPAVSQGILHSQSPEGYAWKANSVCVWRFVAQGTGTVSLNFTSRPICKRGQMCPMFIIAVPFKIDVK